MSLGRADSGVKQAPPESIQSLQSEVVWVAVRRPYMPVVRDEKTVNEFIGEAEADLATVSYTRDGAVLRANEGNRLSGAWAKRNPIVAFVRYRLQPILDEAVQP